jgi:hypothetical protein
MTSKSANLTLDAVRKASEEFSGKASDIIRQLSLAGIGLIWIFRVGPDASVRLDISLLRAAFFIFLALSFDLLQYLLGSVTWYLFLRYKEKQKTSSDTKFEAPTWINYPNFAVFGLKTFCIGIAYAVYILPYLAKKFIG